MTRRECTQKNTNKNVYQQITDLVLEKLENNIVPWHQPWNATDLPCNIVTKKAYTGINTWLLATQYTSKYWGTYRQITELGGAVKKGSKATKIIYFKKIIKIDEETEEEKASFVLRQYNVFNIEQTEGLDEILREEKQNKEEKQAAFNPIARCQDVANGYIEKHSKGLTLQHHGAKAYYSPVHDLVVMPPQSDFECAEKYYSVLYHELGHSTGHKDRLNRFTASHNHRLGHEYSFEELVAEFSASYLCGLTGIANRTLDNSVSYIKGWSQLLSNKSDWIIKAASKAQKAVDLILNQNQPVSSKVGA